MTGPFISIADYDCDFLISVHLALLSEFKYSPVGKHHLELFPTVSFVSYDLKMLQVKISSLAVGIKINFKLVLLYRTQ